VFALLVSTAILPATAQSAQKPKQPAKSKSALLNPSKLNEKAPATYKAKFVTTQGDFVVDVTRSLAPLGADRFYNLVKSGFFDGVKFFRVHPDFVVQFGIHGDPDVSAKWRDANIADDPVKSSNKRGTLTFATAGANTRTTQLFINLSDNNAFLDTRGFTPFGKVADKGMQVVDKLYSGYNEEPSGHQPEIQAEGNKFLDKNYPKLDSIKSASIVK
jgi:peptidyl-prolyl cis-trans isomerase A (cyclophilin A)